MLTITEKSAPPKNKLDANRWPSKERMAGMMAHKTTTRKKITWSFKRIGAFPILCFWGASFHLEFNGAYVTQTNASQKNDFHVYSPIYPIP